MLILVLGLLCDWIPIQIEMGRSGIAQPEDESNLDIVVRGREATGYWALAEVPILLGSK